jgi:Ran GTPase-activating protein (RanGAP) involved in mRNA processing and transport
MGPKACIDLRNLLANNKILAMLNISDNGIGNEGLKLISPALTNESSLIYINLSNNDLAGPQTITYLKEFIRTSK